jgi:hypothetical protein
MDRREVATAVCEIPKYLREHPDASLSARLRGILASRTDPIREADLVSVLSEHRDLIDLWASYIEDQRTSDGWYVAVSTEHARRPDWILARPGRKERLAFDTQIAAYAALILRVVAQGLLGVSRGSH